MKRLNKFIYILIIVCLANIIFANRYCLISIFDISLEQVEKLEIEIYREGSYDLYVINSKETIAQLYSTLNNMEITKVKYYPDHTESYQKDALRVLNFYSKEGKVDTFFVDTPTTIHKFLDSVGNNNDPGYILGKQQEICEEIDEVISNYRY